MILKMLSQLVNKDGDTSELILKKKGEQLRMIIMRRDSRGEAQGIEIAALDEQQVAIIHHALEGLYPEIVLQDLGPHDHRAVTTFVELWDDIGDEVDPDIFKIGE